MPANSNEVIGLGASLTLDDVFKELKKLPGATDKEAKAMAAAMDRAAKSMAASTKKAADEAKKLGDAAAVSGSKAAKAFGPLAGILAHISPEAGQAASGVAALTSAGEGFAAAGVGAAAVAATAALVALAAVAGTGYLAWRVYNDEEARGTVISEQAAEARAALTPLTDALAKSVVSLSVATGDLSAEDAKLLDISTQAFAALGKATEAARQKVDDLHASQTSMTTQLVDGMQSVIPSWTPFGAVLRSLTTDTGEYQAQIDGLNTELRVANNITAETVANNRAAAVTAAANSKATAAAKVAASDRATAERQLNAELIRRIDAENMAREATANAQVAASEAVAKSGEFRLSEIDKLRAAEDAAVLAYSDAAWDANLTAEQVAADEATIRANYQDQITAKQLEESAKRTKAEQDAAKAVADAQAAATAATIGTINQVGGYATQALGMLDQASSAAYQNSADTVDRLNAQMVMGEAYYTDAQKAALEKRTEAAKDAARKQFGAAKAAKVAEAIASTALAAINAIAQSPPPSPFGLIGAGIATAAGAVAVGQIAATEPSFHRGYAPDEMQARVLKSEPIVSTTGAPILGRDNIAKANAGVTPGGGGGLSVVVIGHKGANEIIKRELQTSGALTTALAGDKIVGHRTNRRGTNG